MNSLQKQGVYFLANDQVFDLTVAFLNSLRKFNPQIALCLIPFNNNFSKISNLKDIYNFCIWKDQQSLDFCDKISLQFHNNVAGHYRKLVMWGGIFDEFIYIDIDTIVLKNLDFAFNLLPHFEIITSYSNHKAIEKWVWKESVYDTGILTNEQIEYAANTGFIVSKKGILSLKDVENNLQKALKLKPYMELSCMEQPFLNYLMVTSGKKITSLFSLLNSDLYPEKYLESWGGGKIKKKNGKLFKVENQNLYQVFFIHWAGLTQLKKFDYFLFKLLKRAGICRKIWPVSLLIPNKRYWKLFRNII